MPDISITLTQIVADSAFQPRVEGLDLDHVRALEVVAEAWPPLKVIAQGKQYLLLDGFHRFAAAQNLGLEQVRAEVLEAPADGDLIGLAFALNAVHGRPLTLSDRRAFAARLLRAHPDWSDREIGRRAGLVQPTIGKIRQDLEIRQDIAPAESRIGRDGRSYPAAAKVASVGTSGGAGATAETSSKPKSGTSMSLVDVLVQAFTPAQRITQRNLVRYLERLADLLEEQDEMKGFETIDDAAEACRIVLGPEKAKAIGERLGWSSRNIILVAEALGDMASQP